MGPIARALRVVIAASSATIGRAFSPRRTFDLPNRQGLRRVGTSSNSIFSSCQGSPLTVASACISACNSATNAHRMNNMYSWSHDITTAATVSQTWGRWHLASGKRHLLGSHIGGGHDDAVASTSTTAAVSPSDDELNDSQWQAVTAAVGPVRVVAGPGSGKTRVLTRRIAHLVSQGVPPRSILAVTFTKKAAEEMKDRVRNHVGNDVASRISLGTFHSVCARLLRRHGSALPAIIPGLDAGFSIYDKEDSKKILSEIIGELGLSAEKVKPKEVCSAISKLKSQGLRPEDVAINPDLPSGQKTREKNIRAMYEVYQQRMVRSNALDFDDIILVALRLLQEDKEVFQQVGRQYRHVLVDEWQDTNGPQYQLVLQLVRAGVEAQAADEETNRAAETAIIVARQQGSSGGRSGVEGGEGVGDVKIKSAGRRESLTSKPPPSVFVVGDSDQCIYRFRGADHANVARFAEDFTGCQTVFLRENYRSTGNIARAATAVIEKVQQRIKTETVPVQSNGRPIGVMRCSDAAGEADAVAKQVEKYLNSGRVPASEMAVMYRTNAQSRCFEEAFVRRALPFIVVGAQRFYERREIKDCLAYLRLVANPCDSIAMRRAINTPPRGIGAKTELALETLAASAKETPGLQGINEAECLMSLLEDPELEDLAGALEHEGVGEAREAAGGEQGTGRARWGGFSVRRARVLRKAVESGDVEGVSKAQAKRLSTFARLLCKIRGVAASQGMPELFKAVVEETDMENYVMGSVSANGTSDGYDRWLNVLELERAASHTRFKDMATLDALDSFLNDVAFMGSEDLERERMEQEGGGEGDGSVFVPGAMRPARIQLMTLHASKGLEFDTVFLTGLEEGTFPLPKAHADEERRLMYVGMTRAKARLFLSCREEYTDVTSSGLRTRRTSPSRFIDDIPRSIICTINRKSLSSQAPSRGHSGEAARGGDERRRGTSRRRYDRKWGGGGGDTRGAARSYSSSSSDGFYSAGSVDTRSRSNVKADPLDATTQLFRDVSPGKTRRTNVDAAIGQEVRRAHRDGGDFGGRGYMSGNGIPRPRAAVSGREAGMRDAKVFQDIRDKLTRKRYPVPAVRDDGAKLAEESGENIDVSWAAKLLGSEGTADISLELLSAGVRVGAQVSHPVHGPGEVVALVEGSEGVNVRFRSKGGEFITRVLGSKLKILR